MSTKPKEIQLKVNGIELTVFEWAGKNPALFFAHANSFHGRIWDQVIAHLPEQHCFSIELRGHGRSDKPAQPYKWRTFGQDIFSVGQQLGISGALGIGHSLGGHAVTSAAALDPQLFAALLLIDPVIFRPDQYHGQLKGEHFAARRRNQFESPEVMFQRFKDRLPFSRWEAAVLRDYCEYGLLPIINDDGQIQEYMLACPPAVEAEIYTRATEVESNIYAEIATIEVPVRIMRAGQQQENPAANLSGSPTTPDLVTAFRHGTDLDLPEYSHFIPMESPKLIADQVTLMRADLMQ